MLYSRGVDPSGSIRVLNIIRVPRINAYDLYKLYLAVAAIIFTTISIFIFIGIRNRIEHKFVCIVINIATFKVSNKMKPNVFDFCYYHVISIHLKHKSFYSPSSTTILFNYFVSM